VRRWDGDLDLDLAPETITDRVLKISGGLADHLVDATALQEELRRLAEVLRSAPPSSRQTKPVHSKLEGPLQHVADRLAIVPLVAAYDAAKRAMGAVDYADQMQLAARIVQTAPRVGAILRERHRVVLLDEYQDTGH